MQPIEIELTTAYVVPLSVWTGIDVLHTWDVPVSRLCAHLKIPGTCRAQSFPGIY